MEQIPAITHEADMARMERANKRQFIITIILIAALLISNTAWIIYENQWVDEISYEAEQETEQGSNYFVGGDFNAKTEGDGY